MKNHRTRVLSTSATPLEFRTVDYKFVDARKRAVGAEILTWEETFIAAPEDAPYCWMGSPGHKFAARCQNTRNGRSYGASNRSQYFDTGDERQAYINKYLAQSQGSLFKKFQRHNQP
jgi:hypothetical protein